MSGPLIFKLAEDPAKFESIHRLNYRTFVEEIPQHPPTDAGRLVDRFHAENTYAICLDGDVVVGPPEGERSGMNRSIKTIRCLQVETKYE